MDFNELQEDNQAVPSFMKLKQSLIQFEGNRLTNKFRATLHEMPDGTYLAYDASGYKIRRINKQGKILTQHNIQQPSGIISSKIEVIDDDTLIFILKTGQPYQTPKLVQWNLQTNEKILVEFGTQFVSTLYVFSQTKKLCIVCYRSLYCYNYPLKSNEDEPFKMVSQLPLYHMQLNNHSKIVSVKKYSFTQNQVVLLSIYDILKKSKPTIQLQFKQKFLQNQQIFSSYLIDIWQPNSKSIFLQFQQKFDIKKYHLKHKNLTSQLKTKAHQLAKQTKYNYFIWQFQKQGNEGIRKLEIPQNIKNQECMVQFVGSMRNKNIIKKYQPFMLMQPNTMCAYSPPYYKVLTIILLQTQNFKLVEVFSSQISSKQLLSSQQNCLYNKKQKQIKFIIYCYGNQAIKVSEISIKEFIYSAEIVCTHYMQSLVEDCDEDLLYLAAQMVRGDQKVEKKQKVERKKWKIQFDD